MFFPDNGAPVARGMAAATGRLLTRLLLRRRGGRSGVAGVAACLCAAAVVLAGCSAGPACYAVGDDGTILALR